MVTIITHQGRQIEIVFQSELCDPLNMGEYVRAYCHLHGSDHQRSLSIHKLTGWGHCFNATCDATVLVAEWNPLVAARLLHAHYRGAMLITSSSYPSEQQHPPHLSPPVLPHPTRTPPKWQRDELTTLRAWDEQMRLALLHAPGTWTYLEERGIPLAVAQATGVGYLSPAMLTRPVTRQKRGIGHRWAERIVFPLVSPAGKGYIGRSLWHWRPGMDENAHKALLEQPGAPRRWIKTNPAGWFCAELDQLAPCIILVEGAFDRLILLAARFQAQEVMALVGTAAQADWFPPQVRAVVLALDGDEGGKDATRRLAERLTRAGLCIRVCSPGQDRWGKDWNERWRRTGSQSLWPLYEAYSAVLRSA
jgi:hypothetical protein